MSGLNFGLIGDIAGNLIKAGAPILGTALGNAILPGIGGVIGGQLAGVVTGGMGGQANAPIAGGVIDHVIDRAAQVLGVPKTLEAVAGGLAEALKQGPDVLKAKFAADEAEAAAKWPAMAQIAQAHADVAKSQIDATEKRMADEMAAAGTISWPWMRNVSLFLAASWRPAYAFEGLAECAGLAYLLFWILSDAFQNNNVGQITLLLSLMPIITTLLLPYMAARFGLLGYYMKRRTDEKVASAHAGGATIGIADIVDGLGRIKSLLK